MTGNKNSCTCDRCKGACEFAPGWFRPEQIKPLAKKMGLTVKELFDNHLEVDFWENADWRRGDFEFDNTVFVLRPAVTSGCAGQMADADPRGTCSFFKDGLCAIHELGKPQECKFFVHGTTREEVHANHRETAMAWDKPKHQDLIERLLGEIPCAPNYNPFSLFFGGL